MPHFLCQKWYSHAAAATRSCLILFGGGECVSYWITRGDRPGRMKNTIINMIHQHKGHRVLPTNFQSNQKLSTNWLCDYWTFQRLEAGQTRQDGRKKTSVNNHGKFQNSTTSSQKWLLYSIHGASPLRPPCARQMARGTVRDGLSALLSLTMKAKRKKKKKKKSKNSSTFCQFKLPFLAFTLRRGELEVEENKKRDHQGDMSHFWEFP